VTLSKQQKRTGLSVLVIVLIAFLVGSVNSIGALWKSVYILEGQSLGEYNSVEMDVLSSFEKSYKSIRRPHSTNVEKVRLYISEKNQKKLVGKLPLSVKEWVDGLIVDAGELKKISVKHRGDNPNNWLHDKKSWRIKRKKSNLKDGMRVFNYSLPRDTALINTYLGYYIAQRMNISVPKYQFVELYINDKYQGLYLETQHIDENFLRMTGSMPVNVYKGTPSRTDKPLNQDNDLFNNPYLWEKRAVFNARAESDYSDLEEFLTLTRSSVNDLSKLQKLKKIANVERWARFSAYETIMQSWHNYEANNMYLISDPWRGEIYPIAFDTIFNDTKSRLLVTEPFIMDNAAHALTEVYTNNSSFIYEKYKILNSLIEQDFYSEIRKEASRIFEFIKQSWRDDPSHVQFALTNEFDKSLMFDGAMEREFKKLLQRIDFIESELKKGLESPKLVSWRQTGDRVDLVIDAYTPTNKIKVCSIVGAEPKRLRIASQDSLLFEGTVGQKGCSIFDIALTSNRIRPQDDRSRITTFKAGVGFEIKPTIFSFLLDEAAPVTEVSVMFVGSNEFKLSERDIEHKKYSSAIGNTPLNLAPEVEELVWGGNVYIEKLVIIDQPITILPGTIIELGPDASVIFKNRVRSIGSQEKNIKFIRAGAGEHPWGVVALVGDETNDSTFKYTNMSGGSGGTFDGYVFTGMFSIYSSKRVDMSNLSISNNVNYDDLIHILYSSEISLSNSMIFDAKSDAIDIDISDMVIRDSRFFSAGNDAIDAMTSSVSVNNTYIKEAGDKGISAGESSEVLVVNVLFDDTEIAIQSKDGTSVVVDNSRFLNNKLQLDAYQKNWRYGSGGEIHVENSSFEGVENTIKAKSSSKIVVVNSSFNGDYKNLENKKVILNDNYLIK
jgi:hypothetical protein